MSLDNFLLVFTGESQEGDDESLQDDMQPGKSTISFLLQFAGYKSCRIYFVCSKLCACVRKRGCVCINKY